MDFVSLQSRRFHDGITSFRVPRFDCLDPEKILSFLETEKAS